MKNKKYLFSSGEFAKLNGINKRTLHYYNEIGLFRPTVIDENGYHYYSSLQTFQLELILLLRKLGLSIEEIKTYTTAPSSNSLTQALTEQKKLIDNSIEQLFTAKNFLQRKLDKLELGLSASHGKIEIIRLPETKILLSAPITGAYDEDDFSVASEFSLRLKNIFGLYDNFGSRISVQNLLQKNFLAYDSFFAYGRDDLNQYEALLSEGTYLRTFCTGGWDRLREVYESLLSYAENNHFTLSGYAYEEGLNEMSLNNEEDYITMITVAVSIPEDAKLLSP